MRVSDTFQYRASITSNTQAPKHPTPSPNPNPTTLPSQADPFPIYPLIPILPIRITSQPNPHTAPFANPSRLPTPPLVSLIHALSPSFSPADIPALEAAACLWARRAASRVSRPPPTEFRPALVLVDVVVASMVAVVAAVSLALGRARRSSSRLKDLKRWRMIGREAATIVRVGSVKPHMTRGRELSILGGLL